MSTTQFGGFEVEGLDHVGIMVTDVARSRKFYARVLGLRDAHPGKWGGVPVMMLTDRGGTGLALFPAKGPPGEIPTHGRPGVVDHLAFRVSKAGFEGALKRLEFEGISPIEQDHEICRSLYFDDPDGHRLEITTYDV